MRKLYKVALVLLTVVITLGSMPMLSATKANVSAFTPTLAVPVGPQTIYYEQKFPAGWSFFAFKAKPVYDDPQDIFKTSGDTAVPLNGRLYRWDPYSSDGLGVITYNASTPDVFGAIDPNLGYWLKVDSDTTIRYLGVETYKTRSTWLRKGFNMIAYPYETGQIVDNLKIRNHATGANMNFATARAEGIIDMTIYAWDSEHQGLYDVGLVDDFASNQNLDVGHGYWFNSLKDGYDIIINKPPVLAV